MNAPLVATALAPAKLNTTLRVLGRRADGFHELDTSMVCIGPCDVVEARLRPAPPRPAHDLVVRLALEGSAATDDVRAAPQNLAERAARAYVEALERRTGLCVDFALELDLVKNVPSRAGLGGASSDAAAALLVVRDLVLVHSGQVLAWADCLDELAELGSDTVFFAAARFTGRGRATGRGERVEVLSRTGVERERGRFALVVPDVGCSTPSVYAAFALGSGPAAVGALAASSFANDLVDAARAVEPVLDEWFEALGPRFDLSGSGSALFARATDADDAAELVDQARRAAERLGRTPRWCGVTTECGHGVRLVRAPRRSSGGRP
ncbi:4-diphosphocytidyl-2-C-methyl-D-erythritol kinase [Planctomycetes bacterium Pla163]|uniref:4-diphosphocytidyl-2-C-methyl-D-erythritol kinase n=1 Tax=Rohdeia mirabilis TaxID=2528008 RepID=A0A518CZJ6_9BACT|nr:4-diphosphocytidyl-2-C-methyl-D-erythritol kinase [Planctomycetes bacterium Pla163]